MIRQKVISVLSVQQLYAKIQLRVSLCSRFHILQILFQELNCLNYIPVYSFHNSGKEQLHM